MSTLTDLIPLALSLLQKVLPSITGNSPAITAAVNVAVQAAPLVVETYQDLKPQLMNIIAALKADPATAPAELEKLEEAEKQLDADFDAAAAAALAEDAAAGD